MGWHHTHRREPTEAAVVGGQHQGWHGQHEERHGAHDGVGEAGGVCVVREPEHHNGKPVTTRGGVRPRPGSSRGTGRPGAFRLPHMQFARPGSPLASRNTGTRTTRVREVLKRGGSGTLGAAKPLACLPRPRLYHNYPPATLRDPGKRGHSAAPS